MPTPRIDKLQTEGLVLTQFITEPGCTPSRAGLITGRYAHRSGCGSIIVPGSPNTLGAEEITMAELFKAAGYNTAITGKWHLGGAEQSQPTNQGFDEWRVGVEGSSDQALYRGYMERDGFPEELIAKTAPKIWEGTAENGLKAVREYTVEYRHQIEADITNASIDIINKLSKEKEPFFLYVGFTNSHYPCLSAPEFTGKSPVGVYGDAIMELDYRTGQILDAIKDAGIEENTIVIWVSDDGASPSNGPQTDLGGFNGMWKGDLGDGNEGAVRTPAMIKWPGKIKPGKSNGMVSIHDFFTTLGSIIGADMPTDRAIDGVDQTDFFLGKQPNSNRESVISFLGDEICTVRWRNYRIYPKEFVPSPGEPAMRGTFGARLETNGYPIVYNLYKDPREMNNIIADNAWTLGPYFQIIGAYLKTIKEYPVPKAFSMTNFK
jgi:arylsulfatase